MRQQKTRKIEVIVADSARWWNPQHYAQRVAVSPGRQTRLHMQRSQSVLRKADSRSAQQKAHLVLVEVEETLGRHAGDRREACSCRYKNKALMNRYRLGTPGTHAASVAVMEAPCISKNASLDNVRPSPPPLRPPPPSHPRQGATRTESAGERMETEREMRERKRKRNVVPEETVLA